MTQQAQFSTSSAFSRVDSLHRLSEKAFFLEPIRVQLINKSAKKRVVPKRPRPTIDVSGDFSDLDEIFEATKNIRQMATEDID